MMEIKKNSMKGLYMESYTIVLSVCMCDLISKNSRWKDNNKKLLIQRSHSHSHIFFFLSGIRYSYNFTNNTITTLFRKSWHTSSK